MTDQFLHEIERTQDHGREERYKEAIRNLWDKYQQQQENELETGDLYEEQKKRMRMPPYYMLMQKKRSYPVLPWLPYSAERKKRFPVAKRSTPHVSNEGPVNGLGKTDENVERELSELFGSAIDEKKKRSIDDKPSTKVPDSPASTVSDMRLEENKNATAAESVKSSTAPIKQPTEEHHSHAGHSMAEHKHGKRSSHSTSHESREEEGEEEEEDSDEEHESEEEEEEHDHDHEPDHEHEHEREDEEEEAKRKKKRDAATPAKRKRNASTLRRSMDDMNVMRSKKSIDWSKYFGIDRKKKAMAVEDSNKA